MFALCRTLGVLHPDHLVERLTARQLHEWWIAYQHEPWGDDRDDGRTTAALALKAGVEGWSTFWPYYDPTTPATISDEFVALEDYFREHDRDNRNQAGGANGDPEKGVRRSSS